jgi:mannose-6-phosphate isomerase-like protein (cupin superfamily)
MAGGRPEERAVRRVAVFLLLSFAVCPSAAPAQTPPPAVFISPAEVAQFLESGIAKSAVDQPIKGADVHGGRAMVAMLHRDKAEAGALIHERVTETYYILHGSGTLVTGGSLGDAKPNDLTRLGAGPSQQGTRQGGESRRVGPGDVIIIPAGTVHSFSALDSPISYLVFRFDPGK